MSTFPDDLKKALLANYPKGKVKFAKGWRTRGDAWRTSNGRPVMVIEHHTAGAATDSTNPNAPGNQKGANAGVVNWCIHAGASHAWCNAVVDRDGTIYIAGAKAQWHAGLGSFAGTRWSRWGIPKDSANTRTFGVEIVSKGQKKDFTKAQFAAITSLNVALREASGWDGFKFRIANHKDWAPGRKSDTLYSWRRFYRAASRRWRKRAA